MTRECHHKLNCRNAKCKFQHPEGWPSEIVCPFGAKCRDIDACPFKHDRKTAGPCHFVPKCKLGKHCRSISCSQAHPATRLPVCSLEDHLLCLNLHPENTNEELEECLRLWASGGEPFNDHRLLSSILDVRNKHLTTIRTTLVKKRESEIRMNDLVESLNERQNAQSEIEIYQKTIQELFDQFSTFQTIGSEILVNFCAGKVNHGTMILCLKREIFRLQNKLPALAKRLEIERKLVTERHRYLVIQGATGSGKSTQIPQYITDALGPDRLVICTVPRKAAAIALAERVAFEYAAGNEKFATVGQDIGFCVGGAKKVGKTTRIVFYTVSKLICEMLELHEGLNWNKVAVVILDEAHERTIETDLLLGMFQRRAEKLRHIQLITTSATMDNNAFCKFLGNAPLVTIPGRLFPIDIQYSTVACISPETKTTRLVQEVVNAALKLDQSSEPGDVLCFLTSEDEVLRAVTLCTSQLSDEKKQDRILPFYSQLEAEERSKVFKKLPITQRKIVFSTNVAETSVTIDGIRYVVDPGLEKGALYDPESSIVSIEVLPISQSSATQRAGRAGRTGPGVCIRLYRESEFDDRPVGRIPDIFASPLTTTVLKLAALGQPASSFPWLSAPPKESIERSEQELVSLRAVSRTTLGLRLNTVGKLALDLDLPPAHAAALHYAMEQGIDVKMGIAVSAILLNADRMYWRNKKQDPLLKALEDGRKNPMGDVSAMYLTYQVFAKAHETKQHWKWCKENGVRGVTLNEIHKQVKRLSLQVEHLEKKTDTTLPFDDQLGCIIALCCFPNVAVRIGDTGANFVMIPSGTVASIPQNSALQATAALVAFVKSTKGHTGHIKLCHVTSLRESQIRSIFDKDFMSQFDTAVAIRPTCAVRIEHLGEGTLRGIVGKFKKNVPDIEKKIGGRLTMDFINGTLSTWTTATNEDRVRTHLTRLLDDYRSSRTVELREEPLIGRTRGMFEAGGTIRVFLFREDTVSLILKNLPTNCVERVLKSHGIETRSIVVSQSTDECDGKKKWKAQVNFDTPALTKDAMDRLEGEVVNGTQLEITPGGLMGNITPQNQINAKLIASYSIAPSTGVAMINFTTELAQDALISQAYQVFASLGSNVKCKKVINTYDATLKSVRVTNLPAATDEYDLRARLRTHGLAGSVRSIFVKRQHLENQDENEPLSVQLTRITNTIPLREHVGRICEGYQPEKLCRASLCISYKNIEICNEALDLTRSQKPEMFCGQPIRFEAEFSMDISMHFELYKFLKPRLTLALAEFKTKERMSKYNRAHIRASSKDVSSLKRLKQLLTHLCRSDLLLHPLKDLLFSYVGRTRMEGLRREIGYIHWDHRTKRIRLYGDDQQRKATKQTLESLIHQLDGLVLDESLRLVPSAPILHEKQLQSQYNLLALNIRRTHNKTRQALTISAEPQHIEKLKKDMAAKGWLFRHGKASINKTDRQCGLCFDTVTEPSYTMALCDHTFCRECLDPIWTLPVPYRCPTCSCDIAWDDILVLASPQDLQHIKESAMVAYRMAHQDEIVECPGDTCSQLLKPPRTTQSRDESVQTKLGGWPIECDVCEEEYCLECSTKMQTQVTAHVGVTCKAYQRSLDPLVQTHAIREAALNLTCPHCHKVFFDFSGCCAVTCESCKKHFCGLCLKACTSDQDAHRHVPQCNANVNKGDYFCSMDQLNQVHANMRKQKLISELLSIENLEIRKKVLEDLEQDMKDLQCYVNPNQVGLS